MLTKLLLFTVGEIYCAGTPSTRISIVHERCPYDGVMADAFNQVIDDPGFEYRDCFTTIASKGWEKCIPLQPADMIAYENFKDSLRVVFPRKRRKSLELMIDLKTFGGGWKLIEREALIELKKWMDRARTRKQAPHSTA